MPPALLSQILAALRARFGLSPGAEITIEADPGTFDAQLLAEYRQLGFMRLSMGVQSFQEVGVCVLYVCCVCDSVAAGGI